MRQHRSKVGAAAKLARRTQGFTLLELLLVSAMSGVLIMSWSAFVSTNLIDLHKHLHGNRQLQQFRQLGFWLSHELERSRDDGEWMWQQHGQCLLLSSDAGIRVRQGQLQWRGGSRDCEATGWVSLSEAATFYITELGFEYLADGRNQLQLSARIGEHLHHWQYTFSGAVYVTSQP